jgi:hypothetical protein
MARPHRIVPGPGRPSRYTREIAAEVLQRMFEGESLSRICRDDHLPHDNTVRYWADSGRHPEFTKAFERARRHQAHRWFEETVELADESASAETIPQLGSYQLRVNTRRWASSRIIPEQYGDRMPSLAGTAEVHVYLPVKDGSMVKPKTIDGEARRIEDGSEDGRSDLTICCDRAGTPVFLRCSG